MAKNGFKTSKRKRKIRCIGPNVSKPPRTAAREWSPKGFNSSILFEEWADYVVEMKARDKRFRISAEYESSLRNHILPAFGRKRLRDIRTKHAQAWVDAMRYGELEGERGALAYRTIRHQVAYARAIMEMAVARELVPRNPFSNLKLPPNKDADPERRAQAVFTLEEATELLSADPSEIWQTMIAVCLLTGARSGEVIALEWHDIERAKPLDRLLIRRTRSPKTGRTYPTKTGEPRVAPILPSLARHLERWRSGYPKRFKKAPTGAALMFPSPRGGGHLVQTSFRNHFKCLLEDLGWRDRTVHSMRSTFISLACNAEGVDVTTIARLTHTPIGVHEGYRQIPWSKVCEEALKLPLARVGAHPTEPMDDELTEGVKRGKRA